jgi:predicted ATP-binding protein involved in virulence
MLKFGDICVILGKQGSGKTTVAKAIAKNLQFDFVYIDYSFVNIDYLYDFYENNKNKNMVIILDNYCVHRNNTEIDNLFKSTKKLTLIYVMQYIHLKILDSSDIIYIAKETDYEQIKHYEFRLKKYFKNMSLDWFTNAMEDLSNFGFVCFDKDRRFNKNELYLKI